MEDKRDIEHLLRKIRKEVKDSKKHGCHGVSFMLTYEETQTVQDLVENHLEHFDAWEE